ncbi:Serine/threonine protein kinase [Cryptotrichosporon argae]
MGTAFLASPSVLHTSMLPSSMAVHPAPGSHGRAGGSGSYYSPAASSSSYIPTPATSVHPSPGAQGHPYDWAPGAAPVAGPSSTRKSSAAEGQRAALRRRSKSRGREGANGDGGDDRVAIEPAYGERSYTELKVLGDGSFGTVWLCDWHSPVKAGTLLSAMQSGAGARSEWAGKRLVALKRMKRVWEGGWAQARHLGELVSLRKIPSHPAVIPLYDAFISPKSGELYFVFECMEGNLYQLTKSRKSRPLASGLLASCFHQIVTGLHHIHSHGFFHRDMKPENLLVTTTGLCDYLSAADLKLLNTGTQLDPATLRYDKDVQVIVKLADFGLARRIDSAPPYTEYVSTRWYRAPEVLLRSTEYSAPVDMWALGTILAEMINLKPLFPGATEIDQVYRICDTLGDPTPDYGTDERGRLHGGGQWNSGIKLAKNVGFSFPKRKPVRFRSLFPESTPQSLVDCIEDLLRYNPYYRMTSAQCVDHPYFHETLPHLQQMPPVPRIPFALGQPAAPAAGVQQGLSAPPRQLPPSHAHHAHAARPAFANGDMRTLPPPVGTPEGMVHLGHAAPQPHLFDHRDNDSRGFGASALVSQLRELELPTDELNQYGNRAQAWGDRASLRPPQWDAASMASRRPSTYYDDSVFEGGSQNVSPNASFIISHSGAGTPSMRRAQDYVNSSNGHVAAYVEQQANQVYDARQPSPPQVSPSPPVPVAPAVASSKLGTISTGKKKKWGLSSVFGGGSDRADLAATSPSLPPVDEHGYSGMSSLKRTQSGSHPVDRAAATPAVPLNPKQQKEALKRERREMEVAKRQAAELRQRERARAVLSKRDQLVEVRGNTELEFGDGQAPAGLESPAPGAAPKSNAAYGQARDPRYAYGAGGNHSGVSVQSVASQHSVHSHHSHHSQLSEQALAAQQLYEASLGGPGVMSSVASRHKARRRDEDDDHSMSSFDRQSLMSRSVLTVGTIDSDPGPRRARHEWTDGSPYGSKRAPSASSSHLRPHALMSRSNASLESQLARDFQARATVAAPGSSGSHGGRSSAHGLTPTQSQSPPQPQPHAQAAYAPHYGSGSLSASSLSLGRLAPAAPIMEHGFGASAPTSPYGHPNALAVSHGIGVARGGVGVGVLPAIGDVDVDGRAQPGMINPMFRVPPAQQKQQQQRTTLPPFSEIASVADQRLPQA